VRDGARRLGPVLWAVAALGVGAAFVAKPLTSHSPAITAKPVHVTAPSAGAAPASGSATRPAPDPWAASDASAAAVFGERLAHQPGKHWPAASAVRMPSKTSQHHSVQAATTVADHAPAVAPLHALRQADLLVVAPATLPASLAGKIRKLPHVVAAERIEAATIKVNGDFVQMLGVNPDKFRAFAARPTAKATALWRNVAAGQMAVSYFMGRQDKLPLGAKVNVAGQRPTVLKVGGHGTVGVAGVDAVVSDSVAAKLGIPVANALVISAPKAELASLTHKVKRLLPKHASIAQLVVQTTQPGAVVQAQPVTTGAAGATSPVRNDGPPITPTQARAFLKAALSRVGMPYVWGAEGPRSFDCSGLVQWSLHQAGIAMPRVAVDQARTGPQVPVSQIQPGDLIFYHTDPTAPTYISHVAIYLGNGLMVQAPRPGMNVEIVKADFGGGFAGAVRVYPALAAAVAGSPAG
jgi:peptidoglycan DL-endopeptidase CwlO